MKFCKKLYDEFKQVPVRCCVHADLHAEQHLLQKWQEFPQCSCLRQLCPQSHPARKRASTFSLLSPGVSGKQFRLDWIAANPHHFADLAPHLKKWILIRTRPRR
jgi:hypothetical protein